MNTKNTFLAGALLAALVASPLAQAEEIKYFDCNVRHGFEYGEHVRQRTGLDSVAFCGSDFGLPRCGVAEYDLSDFKATGSYYESDKPYTPKIDRVRGQFIGARLNALPIIYEGDCELKTRSVKF